MKITENETGDGSKFLQDSGLLFEINRTLLHPLGLALSVERNLETGEVRFDRLVDTEDSEGFVFSPEDFAEARARLVTFMMKDGAVHILTREASLGFKVQNEP